MPPLWLERMTQHRVLTRGFKAGFEQVLQDRKSSLGDGWVRGWYIRT